MRLQSAIVDGLVGGTVAAVVSGAPSTAWSLVTGDDVLEPTRAAGSILIGPDHGTAPLLAAAVPVHGGLSLGCGAALGVVLPTDREVTWGALAGVAIAVVNLAGLGPRFPRIRALPALPQLLDHVVFGASVGWVVRERRRRRALDGGTGERRARAPGRGPRA